MSNTKETFSDIHIKNDTIIVLKSTTDKKQTKIAATGS